MSASPARAEVAPVRDVITEALLNARPFDPHAPLFDDEGAPRSEAPIYCTHKLRLVSMADWGHQLPHGAVLGGVVRRGFSLRRPTAKLELEVGNLATQGTFASHRGQRMSALVALACDDICGAAMGRPSSEALALIGALVPSDVLYVLISRAIQRSRGQVPVIANPKSPCPHCGGALGRVHATTADVKVGVYEWEPGSPPTAAVVLAEPTQLGGEMVTAVAVQPARWAAHAGALRTEEEAANAALIQQLMVESSVVGYRTAEGEIKAGTLPARDLRESLMVWDVQAIATAAQSTWGGLWAVAAVKHTCGEAVLLPFDSGELLGR